MSVMQGVKRLAGGLTLAVAAALFGSIGPISTGQAQAQGFPTEPIRVIVPFAPGGRTDVVARLIAEKIQENGWLSQPMVIVNVDGGAGAAAVQQMRRGKADGHTIIHWHHQMLIAEAMKLGDFGIEDFRSLGFTGGGSPLWAVRADSEFGTIEQLIEHLRANPRSLVEALGIGSIPHFVGGMFADAAGFETRYVTASSGADRLRMLLGGNADIALFAASEYLAQGDSLRPLVYFGLNRLPEIEDVPTALELGYDISWANPNWWLAPAGTPDDAAAALSAALEKAMNDPEIVEYFTNNTLEPYWTPGPEAMADSEKVLDALKEVAATIN